MKRGGFLLGCVILVCGLISSNLALAQPATNCPPRADCRRSIVLAKRAVSPQPYCFSCSLKCTAPAGTNASCDDLIIRMKRKATLDPKETLCDETIQCIPPGSILDVDLTYHIRKVGPCGSPVGTHEGKFTILGPTGNVIGSGKMHGTNGLETHVDTQECCAWPHDEGCLEGIVRCTSDTATNIAACKLLATYSSKLDALPIDPANPCDVNNWSNWTANIDGIVQCKCKPSPLPQ